MEKRNYSFYDKNIRMDRVNDVLIDVISQLSFYEICKMFREICYDQVAYYGEENKSIIYNGEYEQLNIEQANRLQRNVSTAVDLFSQSILGKRVFDEKYLAERIGRGI